VRIVRRALARKAVRHRVVKLVAEHERGKVGELDSILRLLRSQLDLSLTRNLFE